MTKVVTGGAQTTTAARELFKGHKACTLGCVYCFADFEAYQSDSGLTDFAIDGVDDLTVIYPSCDNEFAMDTENRELITRLVQESSKRFAVSISVKSLVGRRLVDDLAALHNSLLSSGRGALKCSVSVTTKRAIVELEPRTARYDDRLESMKRLREAGVPTSLNLKPILPHVQEAEYLEIVADFSAFTKRYLLGGLYLDPESEFGKIVVEGFRTMISMREVAWLPTKPKWPYFEDRVMLDAIRKKILTFGAEAFDSDLDVMRSIMDELALDSMQD